MKASTNALTKRWAEGNGWACGTVQQFYGGRRHDLFGIADSVILTASRVIFAQNCSYGSLKAHRDEISSCYPAIAMILHGGCRIMLVEWRRKKVKRGGKRIARQWWCRTQDMLEDFSWGPVSDWLGPFDLYPPKRGNGKLGP